MRLTEFPSVRPRLCVSRCGNIRTRVIARGWPLTLSSSSSAGVVADEQQQQKEERREIVKIASRARDVAGGLLLVHC